MQVDYIVLHHSASADNTTIEEIRQWHLNKGFSDIGYHKVIYQNGEVKQGRNDSLKGAHAFGANAFTLGICSIGNFDINKMKDTQYKSLLQVCATLLKRYGLNKDRLIGHRDVAKMFNVPEGASACPGKFFPMEQLKKDLDKYL
jgi:N-acetyl-anhydromuramyl-L-alanine amidase AmpD